MPTSREGDVIQEIKQAEIECKKAYAGYRRGEGTARIDACDSKLAGLQQKLWRTSAGLANDDR